MKPIFLSIFLFLALFLSAGPLAAQSGSANMARENARANAETQARGELESLLARLCPGRCELVELRAVVSEPRARGDVTPGFEGSTSARFEAQVRRIEATILMDSNLPDNFRTNIPRMAQYRLQYLAPTIDIRPEFLDFPQPQLPPMPDNLPRIAPEPPPRAPQPEPAPEVTAEPPSAPVETAVEEPPARTTPLWQELLPWIALLLTLFILVGLIILLLRRLEDLAKAAQQPRTDSQAEGKKEAAPVKMPDVEALRAELKQSRSVLNRMLRSWINDDPEEVAQLVRFLGTDLLTDLQKDPESKNALESVSAHVGRLHKPLDASEATNIAEKARARHAAQLVVEDSSGDGEWEFLEGLGLSQVTRLLKDTSSRERSYILSRLPRVMRSRYLESLEVQNRRRLLLEASDAESLTRSQARELAGRLRALAEEFADAGRQAQGQAAMIVEMIEAMSLKEQEAVLVDLYRAKPDVANAVLGQICLESTLLHLPQSALSNAIHRLPVESLSTYLQGAEPAITSHILENAPTSKRRALETELSLEIPSTRADFLEARQRFMSTVLATLGRDGVDVTSFNQSALHSAQPQSTPETL